MSESRVDTPTILREIIARKWQEIEVRQAATSLDVLQSRCRDMPACRGFKQAIESRASRQEAAVIAEIKKASPSKGIIRENFHPDEIARSYERHGASCLSVLTDIDFFKGHDDYLKLARDACSLPVIRKDFMVSPYQIYESRALEADCVLLIVACLSAEQMHELAGIAIELGMDVLVEVHNHEELMIALELKQALLGINNRDLHSFEVSLSTTFDLMQAVGDERTIVTESGILSSDDVLSMRSKDIHAFLVGEAFMRAEDPGLEMANLFSF